jgi:hypothetical protein
MTRSHRRALRSGFAAGIVLFAAGVYTFSIQTRQPCPPVGSCDPGGTDYVHLRLAVVLVVTGALALLATTIAAVWWKINELW